MTTFEAKPSAWEINQAAETLRAAGFSFSMPARIRFLSVTEAADVLRINPKWIKEHLSEFPDSVRLPGGQIRIPFSAIKDFAARHRAA